MVTREDLLEVVADHADRIAEGLQLSDQDSLQTAAAIAELRKSDWAEEWQTQEPAKPDALGVIKSDSEVRFSKWLKWQEEKRGRRSLDRTYIGRLSKAQRVAAHCATGTAVTEGMLRPLYWFLDTQHEVRISEVWARAVDLAGEEGATVDGGYVSAAVAEFKKGLPKGAKQKVTAEKNAVRFLRQAQQFVGSLWETGDEDQQRAFDAWYRDFRKGKH